MLEDRLANVPTARTAPDRSERSAQYLLVGIALAVLAVFMIDRLGVVAARGALLRPGLLSCAAVAVWALSVRGPLRTQMCLVTLVALVVALPINRVTGVAAVDLVLFLGVAALLVLAGLQGRSRAVMASRILTGSFLGVMTLSTVLAGSASGLLKLALSVLPAVGAFVLAVRLPFSARRQVCVVVVVLACVLSVLAILEPVAFPDHLYPTQVDTTSGTSTSTEGDNTLLGGLRSQVTFGHPLPFGFFLMIALGLLLRVVRPPQLVVWPVVALFGVAVVFAGSRNSLLVGCLLVVLFGARSLTVFRLLWGLLLAAIAVVAAVVTERIPAEFFAQFLGSGSYTHRVAVLDAFGQLATRQSLIDVVAGNGAGALPSLYERGLLQTDGFNVVDNQFVSALAQGGVIAMVLLAAALVSPLWARDPYWRAAVLVVLINCMIYDWFGWPSSAAMTFLVLGCAAVGGPEDDTVSHSGGMPAPIE